MGTKDAAELLPGTLDLLILKALAGGAMHGYGVAQRLKALSDDVLQVGESSLYPALQRLLTDEGDQVHGVALSSRQGLSQRLAKANFSLDYHPVIS